MVQAAVQLGLEEGKRLRVDTTVVETNIHYPTDATLLWDSVRTITRLVGDLHDQLPNGVKGFTNRTRSARRRMQQLQRMTAQQRQQQQETKYRELLRITGQVVQNARQAVEQAEGIRGIDVVAGLVIDQLRQQIAFYCQLADRVIDQTRRRVIEGEPVPSEQKVYSIFEFHTDLIKRGKAQKPVEFGHKVFLAVSAQGLITDYRVLEGNPADSDHVEAALERHQQTFQHLPSGTPQIAAFTAPPMCSAASRLKSARCASPSGAERRLRSRKPWSAARHSKKLNDSESALRAASPCCFAAGE